MLCIGEARSKVVVRLQRGSRASSISPSPTKGVSFHQFARFGWRSALVRLGKFRSATLLSDELRAACCRRREFDQTMELHNQYQKLLKVLKVKQLIYKMKFRK